MIALLEIFQQPLPWDSMSGHTRCEAGTRGSQPHLARGKARVCQKRLVIDPHFARLLRRVGPSHRT